MKIEKITLEKLLEQVRSIDNMLDNGDGQAVVASAAADIPAIATLYGGIQKLSNSKKKRKKYERQLDFMYRDFLVLLAVHSLLFEKDEESSNIHRLRQERNKLN